MKKKKKKKTPDKKTHGDNDVTLLNDVEKISVVALVDDLLTRGEAHLLQRVGDLRALVRPQLGERLDLGDEFLASGALPFDRLNDGVAVGVAVEGEPAGGMHESNAAASQSPGGLGSRRLRRPRQRRNVRARHGVAARAAALTLRSRSLR